MLVAQGSRSRLRLMCPGVSFFALEVVDLSRRGRGTSSSRSGMVSFEGLIIVLKTLSVISLFTDSGGLPFTLGCERANRH